MKKNVYLIQIVYKDKDIEMNKRIIVEADFPLEAMKKVSEYVKTEEYHIVSSNELKGAEILLD